MKVLNRPMFRYGGPIKEGIMSGIKEPRRGYQQAGFVDPIMDPNLMAIRKQQNLDASKAFQNIFTPKGITSAEVLSGKKKPPGIFGFSFEEPIKPADLVLGEKTKEIIKENKAKRAEKEAQEFAAKVEKKNVPDFDKSLLPKEKINLNENNNNENNNLIDTKDKKTRVNEILSSLGYDRAQKNALYDAMIKTGQRISRTGLGADNLVSDVIADTSQSYDKPEKLREAANLLAVQQDFDIEKIKKTNELKKNPYEEKEAYLTSILGDADLAKRISVGSPKNVIEAAQIVEKAGINSRSNKGVDATLSIYFDGISGVPKYKGELSETNTETLIKLKGDKTVEEFKGTTIGDIDDGVYKLGKGYVDIRDGKIFDVREIISSFIEE